MRDLGGQEIFWRYLIEGNFAALSMMKTQPFGVVHRLTYAVPRNEDQASVTP